LTRNTINLRPIEKSDLWQIWKWHEKKEIYLIENFFPYITYDQFYEEHEKSLKWKRDFLVEDKEDKPCGVCSYWNTNWKNRSCQIGLETYEDNQQNIILEVLGKLTIFLFNEMNIYKLYSYILESSSQINVFKKTGFKLDGRLREHVFRNKSYKDVLLFSLHQDEFSKQ